MTQLVQAASEDADVVDVALPVTLMPPWANPGYLLREKGGSLAAFTHRCWDCRVSWGGDSSDDDSCWSCGKTATHPERYASW